MLTDAHKRIKEAIDSLPPARREGLKQFLFGGAQRVIAALQPPEDEPYLPMPELMDPLVHAAHILVESVERSDKARSHDLKIKEEKRHRVIRGGDIDRLEMDFGAPAYPLTDLARFFNLENSRRYPPLKPVGRGFDRTWNTYKEEAYKIVSSLRRRGFGFWDYVPRDAEYSRFLHFSSEGVTGCFNKILTDVVERRNEMKHLMGGHYPYEGEAVVVPVPTYGLFLDVMCSQGAQHGFRVIGVHRDENGAVNLRRLEDTLEYAHHKKLRIMMYYDNTPNNPTGYLRTLDETEYIGHLLHQQSCQYAKAYQNALLDRYFYDETFDGKDAFDKSHEADITIVDDMAYAGLEHNSSARSFGFAQLIPSPSIVTMFSLSKIGAPGLRAGMALAGSWGEKGGIIERINYRQVFSEFCASSAVVDALCACFERADGRDGFLRPHKQKLRETHRANASLIEAFFYGLDHVTTLRKTEKDEIVREYAAYAKIDDGSARKILNQGLPLFSLGPRPPSGFFYLVDCSNLAGRTLRVHHTDKEKLDFINIHTSDHLSTAFKAYNIDIVPAHRMGYPASVLKARITLSHEHSKLFEFFDHMRHMQAEFLKADPAYQPDLFRPQQARVALTPAP